MKVTMNDQCIVIYLNKYIFKDIDLNNKEVLQKYIKGLLLKIQDNYFLKFTGYYNITLYVDKNYGIIMEIEKDELEYLNYFSTSLDVNIRILEDSFLYEVNDISLNCNYIVYVLDDKIYIKLKNSISNIMMGSMIEKVNKIIYGKEKKEIVKRAKIVRG